MIGRFSLKTDHMEALPENAYAAISCSELLFISQLQKPIRTLAFEFTALRPC